MAVLGSIGTAVFRAQVSVPPDLSALDTGTAGESISGAMSVAAQLPAGPADELISSARDAFTAGINVAGLVGAAVLVGLAVVSLAAFRNRLPTGATSPEPAIPDDVSVRN